MLTVLSLGAGVQSSTLALMAAHGEITPMPDAAIFADTGDEPLSVYRWLDWLEPRLPFPVRRVSAGVLSERELRLVRSKKSGMLYRKSGIPMFTLTPSGGAGILPRKCTRDFKLDPIIREQRRLGAIKRGEKQQKITCWIGISYDEMQRMKDSPVPFIVNRWPLVDLKMRRSDCMDWMKAKGYPPPPRSACGFCPYHSDREWKRLKDDEPAEFQRAVEFERRVQAASLAADPATRIGVPFLHADRVPLDQIDFRSAEDAGQMSLIEGFQNECEGMCGV